ncbi:trans-sulfuration enzyme family protein [Alienimonas californiensis]|uniref:Cystathionine gamma-synthase n=1 Tax=Alienimonas californiensis TaxID=2527989 RepID=A0A517P9E4_9PLAN|nr:PLP-dependent aspartate aminotransferase family protein [Alienimonas californiensis]QDT16000.1 Cystathionine gamma-synthase [Alienimonas californiensis]
MADSAPHTNPPSGRDYSEYGFASRAVHTGVDKDGQYRSATTPIYPTSTFVWDDVRTNRGYDYTRSANPTRRALEENLASLCGGVDCRVTCSGMAAVDLACHLLNSGDHMIAGRDIYGGTYRLFHDVLPKRGIRVSFVNLSDPDEVAAAVSENTRALWIETPSNPLMNVHDVRALVKVAKEKGLFTIADNTFLSPALQRPIELGVDVEVHSTTKYINGHSDVIGGAVVAGSEEYAKGIAFACNALGLGGSPFDCWLTLRGVKTLGVRMKKHEENALAVAQFLFEHPAVEKVHYPGLRRHPGHELAKSQQDGFGAMLSFETAGDMRFAQNTLTGTKLVMLAESLGGIESLWQYPFLMSHASMSEEARRAGGINEHLIRLSVGIEDADDLIADIGAALEAASAKA